MKNLHSKHTNKNKASALIASRFTSRFASLLCACVLLSLGACGQRGSLYIPNTPEAAQRSTIGDVLTKPTSPAPTSTPAAPVAPTSPATPTTPAPVK